MKSLTSIDFATLFVAGISGCAQDSLMMKQGSMQRGAGMRGGMDMKMMDTDNNGVISKQEVMKHHESMYDKMKKDSNGMVNTKHMQMMRKMMMQK